MSCGQAVSKIVMSENVVFLYITTEHLATNFLRAIRLGVGGLVQADGTYQTNWNGFPVIPLGTTDLAEWPVPPDRPCGGLHRERSGVQILLEINGANGCRVLDKGARHPAPVGG